MKPSLLPSGHYRCAINIMGERYTKVFATEAEAQQWIDDMLDYRAKEKHKHFVKKLSLVNPNIEVLGEYKKSSSKIECKCLRCQQHFLSTPDHLLAGHGCAFCSHASTSYVEQYLFAAFTKVFGTGNVISRDRNIIGKELDIYIPNIHVAIEPGTWKYHMTKQSDDKTKRDLCAKKGIRLITIYYETRGAVVPDETDTITYDCNIAFESDHKSLKELINRLLSMVDVTFTFCVADYNAFHEYAYTHSRRMTTEEFIMKVADLVPDVSVLGEYCYGQGRIKCQCNRCGRVWHPVAASLLDGKGCKLCANRQIARNRMVSTEEIKTRLSSVHPAISLVGEYQGYNNKNAFVCKICGHQWKSTMSHALRPQGNGCPHCSRGKRRTHEQFAAEMKVVNPSIQILGEFVNTRTKVCCKCLRCNYEFETIANQLLRGVGCRQCYDKRRAQNLIKR